jgi:hypothetical protein
MLSSEMFFRQQENLMAVCETSKARLLSGDEAVAAAALVAGITLGTGYPGTPSPEILGDALAFGPLALDNALLESDARAKGIDHAVAGQAVCMVVPNIESGNLLGKSVKYLCGSQCAHVAVGAKVPNLIPSRVESVDDKVNSVALGVIYAAR